MGSDVLNLGLIEALADSMRADFPEACLHAALSVLRERGLAVEPNPTRPVWLLVERGSRRLELAAKQGAAIPDAGTRRVVGALLSAALARVEEREAADAIRERLEMLSHASFEGVVVHVDGVPIEVNARFCELIGYAEDEVLHPGFMARCVAPEDLKAARDRIREGVEGEFLLTIIRKDGSRFRAEFCTKQGRLGSQPVRVFALRDVTERERTAALLRESEERLRQILDATFDCVILSRDGVILDVGARSDGFLGWTRAGMLGRNVVDFAAPAARDTVSRRIGEGVLGAYETVVRSASGELVPMEIVSVMSTLDGKAVRAAGLRDLREARRLERERRRMELQAERGQRIESLGVLAGGIAHDFNNLLVAVLGSAELLMDRLEGRAEAQLAATILTAGERAAALTKQMLIYAGRQRLAAPAPLDLAELWHELESLLGVAISKKARLRMVLPPGHLVMGDRTTLMQVFMNLLTNASDALEGKPGEILVSLEKLQKPDARWDDALGATITPGDWVLLRVQDTGCGMNARTQRRIFEPFFSTKELGQGLGLSSCLGIVTSHGGAVLVESERGHGSSFSLLLPAVRTDSRAATGSPAPSSRPTPCRVLVVDDEAIVRVHLRRLLELRGFDVHEAEHGRAAVEAVESVAPDLVILDLNMPELDGAEVVRRLRARGETVPVVLCSGNLDQVHDAMLQPGSVQSLLQKPFSAEELMVAVQGALAREARGRP